MTTCAVVVGANDSIAISQPSIDPSQIGERTMRKRAPLGCQRSKKEVTRRFFELHL